MDRGWTRVAEMVAVQRVRRGYRTMAAFAQVTGLSMTTIDALEHARKTGYHPSTITIVEHALGWKPGAIQRIFDGLEPQPLNDPELAALLDLWPKLNNQGRRMVLAVAEQAARTA